MLHERLHLPLPDVKLVAIEVAIPLSSLSRDMAKKQEINKINILNKERSLR